MIDRDEPGSLTRLGARQVVMRLGAGVGAQHQRRRRRHRGLLRHRDKRSGFDSARNADRPVVRRDHDVVARWRVRVRPGQVGGRSGAPVEELEDVRHRHFLRPREIMIPTSTLQDVRSQAVAVSAALPGMLHGVAVLQMITLRMGAAEAWAVNVRNRERARNGVGARLRAGLGRSPRAWRGGHASCGRWPAVASMQASGTEEQEEYHSDHGPGSARAGARRDRHCPWEPARATVGMRAGVGRLARRGAGAGAVAAAAAKARRCSGLRRRRVLVGG